MCHLLSLLFLKQSSTSFSSRGLPPVFLLFLKRSAAYFLLFVKMSTTCFPPISQEVCCVFSPICQDVYYMFSSYFSRCLLPIFSYLSRCLPPVFLLFIKQNPMSFSIIHSVVHSDYGFIQKLFTLSSWNVKNKSPR